MNRFAFFSTTLGLALGILIFPASKTRAQGSLADSTLDGSLGIVTAARDQAEQRGRDIQRFCSNEEKVFAKTEAVYNGLARNEITPQVTSEFANKKVEYGRRKARCDKMSSLYAATRGNFNGWAEVVKRALTKKSETEANKLLQGAEFKSQARTADAAYATFMTESSALIYGGNGAAWWSFAFFDKAFKMVKSAWDTGFGIYKDWKNYKQAERDKAAGEVYKVLYWTTVWEDLLTNKTAPSKS